jgi:hypothetical protein
MASHEALRGWEFRHGADPRRLGECGFANGRTGSRPGEPRYKGGMRRSGGDAARREWASGLAWVTLAGVFLGLVGPFGSFFNGPVWQRVAYWTATSWLGLAVYGSGARMILRRVRTPAGILTALAAMVLLVSVPFGVLSWAIATTIWPALKGLSGLTPTTWYLEGLAITTPQVAVFSALVWSRRRRPSQGGPAPPVADLLGVPAGEILCLQMEDHYIRVHTAAGSRLVLATMGQAIAALGSARGLRVHRSWWVAERAVAGVASEGRNLRLTLVIGLAAPVARASVVHVRQAGWLDRHATAASVEAAPAGHR